MKFQISRIKVHTVMGQNHDTQASYLTGSDTWEEQGGCPTQRPTVQC